ncbi:DUF3068 domain-containing protein [Pedococcus sp. 5OH_020]|uniref:DUF3068 domain-containing protein n=1 Tax=Pedococcus sp. 5OH_020 TaxID=2989814 RepID=UPI0022E9D16F|nr:DUF3068 domain-containing protein [Pedococcus sp. 5OH_020]
MKRSLGLVLFGLGVLLLVMAPVVRFAVAPALVRAPLDINVTLKAGGTGFQYLDAKAGGVVPITVDITRHLRGDVAAGNHDVAVYDETLCLTRDDDNQHPGCLRDDDRIVANYQDRIAFDRVSGYAVTGRKCGESGAQECKASVDGEPVAHRGLGYKFPMFTGKTDYQYFDTVSKHAWPIEFKGVEKREGLEVYKFVQTITDAPAMTSGIFPSLYSNVRTLWVEPRTGVIIHGQEQIDQRLTGLATTEPGSDMRDPALAGKTALKGTLAFTQAADRLQAGLARDGIKSITGITMIVPLAALLLGIILAGFGIFLARGADERRARARL